MKYKLNQKMEVLLMDGASTNGLEPDMILCQIEESLVLEEYRAIEAFLKWLVKNKKTFGHGTIQAVWSEWQKGVKI